MFACLHISGDSLDQGAKLAELAGLFAPTFEVCDPATVIFPVDGLGSLIGSPKDIAAAIAREGERLGIRAHLAIASNPDAALQAARHYSGITVIAPGQEAERLGNIPLSQLPMPPEMQDTLSRWGIRTFSEFAALPPLGIVERFGMEGVELQDLARGVVQRPLQISRHVERYEKSTELEDGLDNLEPLLFLLNGMLTDLCREMSSHGVAASELHVRFELESKTPDQERVLAFPVPMREAAPMLKLLQLHLEANPPQAEVIGVSLVIRPVEPRVAQSGLFCPQAPEPARLQITLARIGGIVGEHNVGSIELLDTHRPDAFLVKPFVLEESGESRQKKEEPTLALRIFRPPLAARVIAEAGQPRRISAPGISGNVTESAGPWRGSGDWWNEAVWARDEWDVSLTDGGVYRIYRDAANPEAWFIAGVYD
jgi:protein ImuB